MKNTLEAVTVTFQHSELNKAYAIKLCGHGKNYSFEHVHIVKKISQRSHKHIHEAWHIMRKCGNFN
ncbi:CLUMA_CG000731, isoform A [Clunio marinus]|uniref:CLUMA_CG000731, isoform A n=1 Tax=Clunio marinus TaxID=568069 RepID=A0A1J1HKC1_9DIPT|nr:CLUMA_CG000731, isoform A [Clunio marinus]